MRDLIEANLFAFPLFHRWSRTVDAHDGPELLWTRTDVPHPLFNSVLRARLSDPDAAIEAVTTRGMPVLWWVGPSSLPPDLGARLVAHGFRHAGENPGMARPVVLSRPSAKLRADYDGEGLPDPARDRSSGRGSFAVWAAQDDRELRVWNSVPGGSDARLQFYTETRHLFRHYVAYVDGQPAGTASLFPAAGVAGIYNVYTKPELRRRGIGEALTQAALNDARDLGYDTAVLQASEESVRLYRRMGFVEHCTIAHYVWSA